ncbi:MAG: dicarboxylate transporter, DctP subunit, partial [Clostridia bacterium]|nr:dicarboxylate transporter, DctP subunit [Clostridia bacterium]
FDDAAKESAKFNRQSNREMNKSNIADLKKAGMTITELTPDQLKAFQDAVAPVYKQFEEQIGKDLIAEFQNTVKNAK